MTMERGGIGRRTFCGAAGAFVIDALAQTPAFADPATERPMAGDYLIDPEDASKTPLTVESLGLKPGDPQKFAWPVDAASKTPRSGSRLNKILLVRLDPETMSAATKARAADGIVAYSAVCPHGGCDVVNWTPGANILECPCHNSQYDPRDAARVVDGPAPKPLPALPLKIDGGLLVVAGPFSSKPGFAQT